MDGTKKGLFGHLSLNSSFDEYEMEQFNLKGEVVEKRPLSFWLFYLESEPLPGRLRFDYLLALLVPCFDDIFDDFDLF